MKEEMRIKQDYGTVCGFTGKWLVQHRLDIGAGWSDWMTICITSSEAEARKFIDTIPEWAKVYK